LLLPNPERLRSEAAFARLSGAAPIPISSGRTDRHRLHRGGDRDANSALWRVALVRRAATSRPRTTSPAAPPKANQDCCGASTLHRPGDVRGAGRL